MNYIHAQLAKNSPNTKVVLVPSTNEVSHIYPLP